MGAQPRLSSTGRALVGGRTGAARACFQSAACCCAAGWQPLWMLFTREFRPAFSFRLGIAIALGVMVLWLGAAWSAFPENTHHYLRAWSAGGVERFNAFSARALIYAL